MYFAALLDDEALNGLRRCLATIPGNHGRITSSKQRMHLDASQGCLLHVTFLAQAESEDFYFEWPDDEATLLDTNKIWVEFRECNESNLALSGTVRVDGRGCERYRSAK